VQLCNRPLSLRNTCNATMMIVVKKGIFRIRVRQSVVGDGEENTETNNQE
jgi:hypothetical protein